MNFFVVSIYFNVTVDEVSSQCIDKKKRCVSLFCAMTVMIFIIAAASHGRDRKLIKPADCAEDKIIAVNFQLCCIRLFTAHYKNRRCLAQMQAENTSLPSPDVLTWMKR